MQCGFLIFLITLFPDAIDYHMTSTVAHKKVEGCTCAILQARHKFLGRFAPEASMEHRRVAFIAHVWET